MAERAGCSVETIKKIEAGKLRPGQQLGQLLADRLAVPPEERGVFLIAARLPVVASRTSPAPAAAPVDTDASTHPPVQPSRAESPTHQVPTAERYRRRVLTKVRQFWVQGVLDHALDGAVRIALGMQYQPDAVVHPWHVQLQSVVRNRRPVPKGVSIIQVFDELGEELLILGGPGAGTTIMLLELARALVVRAEADPAQPIPVVFTLTSWLRRRGSIVDWLVAELHTRYALPRKVGRGWIESGGMIVLLDGLDEVQAGDRAACVATLNQYRHQHSLGGIAVCRRRSEYENLNSRLQLQGAMVLQPRTWPQVVEYLAQAGVSTDALRDVLQADTTLHELITTPLLIRVASLAYQDMPGHAPLMRMAEMRGRCPCLPPMLTA